LTRGDKEEYLNEAFGTITRKKGAQSCKPAFEGRGKVWGHCIRLAPVPAEDGIGGVPVATQPKQRKSGGGKREKEKTERLRQGRKA